MGWQPIAIAGFGQGLGMGMIFVPLSLVTFGTLPMAHRNEATALFSLVRNVGGSIGISLAENYLSRATQVSHQAIAAQVTPYNQALWDPSDCRDVESPHDAGPGRDQLGSDPAGVDDRLSTVLHADGSDLRRHDSDAADHAPRPPSAGPGRRARTPRRNSGGAFQSSTSASRN